MTTGHVDIAPGNQAQFEAWNGEDGQWWAANSAFFDAAVRNVHQRLMAAADIGPTDRVLDVGCGTGQGTLDAARRASEGSALGIDLSAPMLRVAEAVARRDGVKNASFVLGDAQQFAFASAGFDGALSRMGAMFFADQGAAFANIARALRPGGRLAMVAWRAARDNEWLVLPAEALVPGAPAPTQTSEEPTPFRHADPRSTSALLETAGFEKVVVEPLDLPMYFGRDARAAFAMMRQLFGWLLRDLEPIAVDRALDRLRELVRAHETPAGVIFGSASWLITARRDPKHPSRTGAPA